MPSKAAPKATANIGSTATKKPKVTQNGSESAISVPEAAGSSTDKKLVSNCSQTAVATTFKPKLYQFKLVLLGIAFILPILLMTCVCFLFENCLGDSAVGKSSIVMRFSKGSFQENQESTIGAAFVAQTIHFDDHSVKFEIWDTAGQERYHSLAPMYYRGAQAAIVVYDVSCEDSFEKAINWVKELHKQSPNTEVIALVGNKIDLNDERTVQQEVSFILIVLWNLKLFQVAKELAQKFNLLFFETSAKTGENIENLFREIALKLPKTVQMKDLLLKSGSALGRSVMLDSGDGVFGRAGENFAKKAACC